jgi:hypothetical protein
MRKHVNPSKSVETPARHTGLALTTDSGQAEVVVYRDGRRGLQMNFIAAPAAGLSRGGRYVVSAQAP